MYPAYDDALAHLALQDYEGSLLMECRLHPKVEYMNIPAMVYRQKQVSLAKLSNSNRYNTVAASALSDPKREEQAHRVPRADGVRPRQKLHSDWADSRRA